jgi:lysophospholipase L1-like esterase
MLPVRHWLRTNRRFVLGALGAWAAGGLAGCGGGGGGAGEGPAAEDPNPHGTWSGPLSDLQEDVRFLGLPAPAPVTFQDQTLRQVAHLSLGGDHLRIKFGNLYGQSPVTLVRVRAALGAGAGAIDVATDVAVTFQGRDSVSIPAGGEIWSDKVAMRVPDGADVAVSVYVRSAADGRTAHRYANAVQYVAPGDLTSAAGLPSASANQITSWHWMSAVDVYRAAPTRVVVAFGDSLTDGNGSTLDAHQRYPDLLSARFRTSGTRTPVSVVNAGLGGNRWLHDRFGPKGVDRFWRDVLGVSGVTHAIVQMGINDIGFQWVWTPDEKATTQALTDSLAGVVASARAAGVQVYLGTLTPFKGHVYFTEEGERMRQAVNTWIRANTSAAGVFDFDAMVRDPAEPARILAAYRADDSLHLNDLGYARLAHGIPIELFV